MAALLLPSPRRLELPKLWRPDLRSKMSPIATTMRTLLGNRPGGVGTPVMVTQWLHAYDGTNSTAFTSPSFTAIPGAACILFMLSDGGLTYNSNLGFTNPPTFTTISNTSDCAMSVGIWPANASGTGTVTFAGSNATAWNGCIIHVPGAQALGGRLPGRQSSNSVSVSSTWSLALSTGVPVVLAAYRYGTSPGVNPTSFTETGVGGAQTTYTSLEALQAVTTSTAGAGSFAWAFQPFYAAAGQHSGETSASTAESGVTASFNENVEMIGVEIK